MVRTKMVFVSDKIPNTLFTTKVDAMAAELSQDNAKTASMDADYVGTVLAAVKEFQTLRSNYLKDMSAVNALRQQIRDDYEPKITQVISFLDECLDSFDEDTDDEDEDADSCDNCDDTSCQMNPKHAHANSRKVTPKYVGKKGSLTK